MNILLVHNYYQQAGGEDHIFADESALLAGYGHKVIQYTQHNDDITEMRRVSVTKATFWNQDCYHDLRHLIRSHKIDVVHCHNTFPLISPAAYYAAKKEGVPVVQTLHNYRLLCSNAKLFRDGQVCEDCLGKPIPLPGVIHSCYRNDRTASVVVTGMLAWHRLIQTWQQQVDIYIALTEFARQKFIEGGFPANKIVVKPNFVHPAPEAGTGKGEYALFVGRLVPEKGLITLLKAWEQVSDRLPLKILGDGPLADQVNAAAIASTNIKWLGQKSLEEVYSWIGNAKILVCPSEWYEGFPRTIVEAFAKGTPVIASKIGSLIELVDQRNTGMHFAPGNVEDLRKQVEWLLSHPQEVAAMRSNARAEFEKKYTAEQNYQRLIEIYKLAAAAAQRQ